MKPFEIRPVRANEITRLPDIEADAAEAFREFGLDFVADQPPRSAAEYAEIAAYGAVLVVASDTAGPFGFAAIGRIDGQAWLRELSVRRQWSGQGAGRMLLDAVIDHARRQGHGFLALTTFADLPFNGRFYQSVGFAPVNPVPDWPELAAIRQTEMATGMERCPRVAMIRNL